MIAGKDHQLERWAEYEEMSRDAGEPPSVTEFLHWYWTSIDFATGDQFVEQKPRSRWQRYRDRLKAGEPIRTYNRKEANPED